MKVIINTLVGIALLGATFGLSATPAGATDGVLFTVEVYPGYCHMQFPAIDEERSIAGRPVLQDASTTDIIDFYGPCDHDPLGREEVQGQRDENRWSDEDGPED